MIGRDKAPSHAFEMLRARLRDMEVTSFLGHGDPIKATIGDIEAAVRKADVLLSGMSSSPELVREELAAINCAASAGVPVVLYADQPGRLRSVWFHPVRGLVDAMLVVHPSEIEDAKSLFPRLRTDENVIVSGNPVVETAFFPKTDKGLVRKTLGVREDETVILVQGYKFPAVSLLTIFATIDALNMVRHRTGKKFFLAVSLHPGDSVFKAKTQSLGALIQHFLAKELTDLGGFLRYSFTGDRLNTVALLPGMDLVVTTQSTIEEMAACQRIPVVHHLTSIALDGE